MIDESSSNTKREMGEKDKLKRFYRFAEKEFPEGFLGEENSFPVTIGDNKLSAVLFTMEEGKVRMGLFVPGGKYARKTLEIDIQGNITEEKGGTLYLSVDPAEYEPNFDQMSNEEIVIQIIDQSGFAY